MGKKKKIKKAKLKKKDKGENTETVYNLTENSLRRRSSIFPCKDFEKLQTDENYRDFLKVYPQRWWLLYTVIFLNIANYAHWVAFPSVAKIAAKYYKQSEERLDYIPTISYAFGVPFCLVSTYIVEEYGLKVGLHIGGYLTGIGGLMCFASSSPFLGDYISDFGKYYLALVGQALTGIASPFISCMPTKISQNWFSDKQRMLATILLGMSNPLGIILGQFLTPRFVLEPSHIPLMNFTWFCPACLGAILTLVKVKSDIPPTPPSKSAFTSKLKGTESQDYLLTTKDLFTNWPFIILFVFMGGCMGYLSSISTKMEQILSAKGYSNQFAGLCSALIFLAGFITSFPFGLISSKLKKPVLVCKAATLVAIPTFLLINYYMKAENEGVIILVSCGLLGTFMIGPYPIALELLVESTYPTNEVHFLINKNYIYIHIFF